ncbi:MAG: FHA domain-containing protein, partial [Planctomycetota bacterium]
MAHLRVIKVRRISRLTVEGASMTIGRSSQNDVVLPHTSVSRNHCVIEFEGGDARVRDLESRHGTKVNGRKITEVSLTDGDRILIGPFELVFVDPEREFSIAAPAGQDGGLSADMEAMQQELESRAAALRESQEQLQDRTEALDQREAERDQLQQQAETLRQQRDELEAGLEAAQTRTETDRDRIAELETRLEELESQQEQQAKTEAAAHSELTERLETTERELAESRQHLERANGELETRSHRLDEAVALSASLEERIKELEADERLARRQSHDVERTLSQFEMLSGQLRDVSRRLSSNQRNIRGLEQLWTETNDWVDETDRGDVATLRHLVQQRDSVGQQLEAAHQERDNLLAEMQTIIDRIGQVATTTADPSEQAGSGRS